MLTIRPRQRSAASRRRIGNRKPGQAAGVLHCSRSTKKPVSVPADQSEPKRASGTVCKRPDDV